MAPMPVKKGMLDEKRAMVAAIGFGGWCVVSAFAYRLTPWNLSEALDFGTFFFFRHCF